MIKHAADFKVPLLNAEERVNLALDKITEGKSFNDEQRTWLSYIRQHLIENLALTEEDFKIMPIFEQRGGLGKAKKIFGEALDTLIKELNEVLAA